MKLINFKHRYDFGHDWYVQVINVKGWSLLQSSLSWNDYASYPFIQIKLGGGSTLSILLWVYKLGFDIGIIERTEVLARNMPPNLVGDFVAATNRLTEPKGMGSLFKVMVITNRQLPTPPGFPV